MHAAIDRILHRHILLRGGTATAAGDLAWDVSFFQADPDDDASPPLSFRCRFTVEGGRATVSCDAPTSPPTPEQAAAIDELRADLALSLERERVGFASFAELAAYLVDAGATEEEGTIEVPAGDESVYLSVVPVSREPWVSFSIPFEDDADPEWLLAQNGDMTHVHFEAFEDSVSLACAFPLALLTGERLVELVDDLATFRERLLDDLEGGGEEDEDAEG